MGVCFVDAEEDYVVAAPGAFEEGRGVELEDC